jgi:prolyl-tRNA editing enzyme YbaK/EbsC (Cys-tRNA(Pro) deacylase)
MSYERAYAHLQKYNAGDRINILEENTATVALAALALGVEEARIAKTLSYYVDDAVILIVCAGDVRVNGGKFKRQFGCKPKMLSFDDAEPLIGHAIGGVCPFGVNDCVRVYLDESLKRFETVFPAAGTDNSMIELTCEELEKFGEASGWVDVCKLPAELA